MTGQPQTIPEAPKFSAKDVGKTCLVTGGAGYVGSAIVRRLVESGCTVRSFDVVDHEHKFAGDGSVETIVGDLRNYDSVRQALEGVDSIFHTAAIIKILEIARPATRRFVWEVNCVGTDNVVRAAQDAGVKALVQTSSFSVVLDRVLNDKDETTPYATRTKDLYTVTKIESEKRVLGADTEGALRTCALRPGGVWGTDAGSMMIKSFLQQFAAGKFTVLIGNGKATMDNTHVENLVDAHLLAAKNLRSKACVAGGQAYFITDDEAINGLEWFRPLVEGCGKRWPRLRLPAKMMMAVGRSMEIMHYFGGPEPLLTHRGVRNLTESCKFRIDKARRDLGYEPRFNRDRGMPILLPKAREFVASLQGHSLKRETA